MNDQSSGLISSISKVHIEDIGSAVQDADSEDKQGKKSEGAFYMWTEEEVREVLGTQADPFMAHYYIKPGGNADLSPK